MKFEARIKARDSLDFPFRWSVFEVSNINNHMTGTSRTVREAKRKIKKAAKLLKGGMCEEVWEFEL